MKLNLSVYIISVLNEFINLLFTEVSADCLPIGNKNAYKVTFVALYGKFVQSNQRDWRMR